MRYLIFDFVIILFLFVIILIIFLLFSVYKLNFCDKVYVDDFKYNGNIFKDCFMVWNFCDDNVVVNFVFF